MSGTPVNPMSVEALEEDRKNAIWWGRLIGFLFGAVFASLIVFVTELEITTWWVAAGAVGFSAFIGYAGGVIGETNQVAD